MGGNKTALAAMELVKRTTLKGEEVAVYLDVMEFLQGIAKEEFLVFSVTDMQTLKADNKELRRQIAYLTEQVKDEPDKTDPAEPDAWANDWSYYTWHLQVNETCMFCKSVGNLHASEKLGVIRCRECKSEFKLKEDYVAPITPEEAGLKDIEWFHCAEGICPKCSAMLMHYCSVTETYKCFAAECNWQGESCDWAKTEAALSVAYIEETRADGSTWQYAPGGPLACPECGRADLTTSEYHQLAECTNCDWKGALADAVKVG